MNFTYCLQATEERRRNARGSSQQLLAAHAGRTKEEQWSQAAQVIGKCLLCLLAVAPPLLGQKSAPPPANADRASLALQGDPRPHLELSDGSTTFDGRADSSASVAAKSTINTNNAADYGQQTKAFCISCPISNPCQQVLNFLLPRP
jgi:hypothetical protein